MINRYKSFYWNIAKHGIHDSIGLPHYLREAVYYKRNHDLVSAIDQRDWLYFNNIDPKTSDVSEYVATLTQDLKAFNVSIIYEQSIHHVAIVPVSYVFKPDTIKKFHLGAPKPKKSTTKKPKAKAKSDTPKHKHTTKTKRAKRPKRTRKGRKPKKSPKRKASK